MNYTPIERIAAKLPEAPFYITDMDFPIIVENVFEALKDFRMLPLTRVFKDFQIVDYEVNIGCHHMVHNVVRLEETVSGYGQDQAQINQLVFKQPEDVAAIEVDLETSQIDLMKKNIPHIIGRYIDYGLDGNCLKFKETDISIGIEYNTLKVDSETGYPVVPENAETAVLWYCAFQHYTGEFMAGRLDGGRLQYAEARLEDARRAAKADSRLSQNQLDKLLNTMSSFDRKSFGWSA